MEGMAQCSLNCCTDLPESCTTKALLDLVFWTLHASKPGKGTMKMQLRFIYFFNLSHLQDVKTIKLKSKFLAHPQKWVPSSMLSGENSQCNIPTSHSVSQVWAVSIGTVFACQDCKQNEMITPVRGHARLLNISVGFSICCSCLETSLWRHDHQNGLFLPF